MLHTDSSSMNPKETQEKKVPIYQIFSNDMDKFCPTCGQGKIPFKLGVCMCGNQMGRIQHVNDTEKFAKNQYHFYVGMSQVEKLRIEEMIDNTVQMQNEFDEASF